MPELEILNFLSQPNASYCTVGDRSGTGREGRQARLFYTSFYVLATRARLGTRTAVGAAPLHRPAVRLHGPCTPCRSATPHVACCVNIWHKSVTFCAKSRTDPSVGRSRVPERGTSGHAAAHCVRPERGTQKKYSPVFLPVLALLLRTCTPQPQVVRASRNKEQYMYSSIDNTRQHGAHGTWVTSESCSE